MILVSCDDKTEQKEKNIYTVHHLSDSNYIPTIETNIILNGIEKSNFKGVKLTDSIAKKILYTYFEDKGYYNSDNMSEFDKLTEAENDKLSVSFNEIYITELNGNKNEDAIISYWLTPLFASGHCWQPHKAILLDTDKGYKILNEDFISQSFAIDSVKNNNGQVIIYGYEYDCGNRKVLKHIKAKIK